MTHTRSPSSPSFVGAARRLDGGLRVVERGLLVLTCALAGLTALNVAFDALGRYFFNQPLGFTIDLVTKYLLPAMLFLGLAEALRNGDHIHVNAFARYLPKRLAQCLLGLGFLLSALFATVISLLLAGYSHENWARNIIAFGPYPWPAWLEVAIVALSWIMLCLRLWFYGVVYTMAPLLRISDLRLMGQGDVAASVEPEAA